MMTGREAEFLLGLGPDGITRRKAQRVLGSGLAGPADSTPASLLYDEHRVDELTRRPHVPVEVLERYGTSGLFVARRDVDVLASRDEQLEHLAGGWRLGLPTVVWLWSRIERQGFVPLVATVGGFVATGAEITDVTDDRTTNRYADQPVVGRRMPRSQLRLREAGDWFAEFSGRRMRTGGGQPAYLIGWRR